MVVPLHWLCVHPFSFAHHTNSLYFRQRVRPGYEEEQPVFMEKLNELFPGYSSICSPLPMHDGKQAHGHIHPSTNMCTPPIRNWYPTHCPKSGAEQEVSVFWKILVNLIYKNRFCVEI